MSHYYYLYSFYIDKTRLDERHGNMCRSPSTFKDPIVISYYPISIINHYS